MVKQEPASLRSRLQSIMRPINQELRATRELVQKVFVTRKIALFTVAFSSKKRGGELTRAHLYSMC